MPDEVKLLNYINFNICSRRSQKSVRIYPKKRKNNNNNNINTIFEHSLYIERDTNGFKKLMKSMNRLKLYFIKIIMFSIRRKKKYSIILLLYLKVTTPL